MAVDRLWSRLGVIARREGLSALGRAQLPAPVNGLPSAISLVAPLSTEVIAEVARDQAPTMTYYHHYRTANALLDRAAFLVAGTLMDGGFRAFPIPASQTVDREAQAGLYPHKTAATLAGLGWIPPPRPAGHGGTRSACASGHSLDGHARPGDGGPGRFPLRYVPDLCRRLSSRGHPRIALGTGIREALVDAFACLAYMRTKFDRVGRGSVCGICMAVCPGGEAG